MLMLHHRLKQVERLTIPHPAPGRDPYPRGSWTARVHATGLAHLGDVTHRHYDAPLIAAFVERWHPETNSFHMPFGEMTIMLYDVLYILGLPIEDRIVTTGRDPSPSDVAKVLAETFSFGTAMVLNELEKFGGLFKTINIDEARREQNLSQRQLARGFILQLLGATLFVDKSKDKLDPIYILLLQDLSHVKAYAWGATTLAYLYRQLGVASRRGCKQMAGCLTLLQV